MFIFLTLKHDDWLVDMQKLFEIDNLIFVQIIFNNFITPLQFL